MTTRKRNTPTPPTPLTDEQAAEQVAELAPSPFVFPSNCDHDHDCDSMCIGSCRLWLAARKREQGRRR